MKTAHDLLAGALSPAAFQRTLEQCEQRLDDAGNGLSLDVDALNDLLDITEARRLVSGGILVRP